MPRLLAGALIFCSGAASSIVSSSCLRPKPSRAHDGPEPRHDPDLPLLRSVLSIYGGSDREVPLSLRTLKTSRACQAESPSVIGVLFLLRLLFQLNESGLCSSVLPDRKNLTRTKAIHHRVRSLPGSRLLMYMNRLTWVFLARGAPKTLSAAAEFRRFPGS
jgi:hypothetical protein